jgi:outer membrane immunogenic protein
MIRKFGWALAAVVSVAGLGAASAADMAVKARPMPVPIYNWTGCYIGLSGGAKGIGTNDNVTIPAATGLAGTSTLSTLDLGRGENETWLAGGQAGCNYQSGNWVFGVEADAHAQRWGRTETVFGGVLPALFVAGDTFELRSNWQASARGRIGYAMDRTMFYVTGGAAFTDVRAVSTWIPSTVGILVFPGVIATQTKTLVGGTVGAGVEYAATDNFTVGLEGRYSLYGSERFNAGLVPVLNIRNVFFTSSPTYRDVKVETGEILFRANWKFTSGGALVARY